MPLLNYCALKLARLIGRDPGARHRLMFFVQTQVTIFVFILPITSNRALLYQGFAVLPVTSEANAIGTTDEVEGISVYFDNGKCTLLPAAVRIMDISRLHADARYRNIFFQRSSFGHFGCFHK